MIFFLGYINNVVLGLWEYIYFFSLITITVLWVSMKNMHTNANAKQFTFSRNYIETRHKGFTSSSVHWHFSVVITSQICQLLMLKANRRFTISIILSYKWLPWLLWKEDASFWPSHFLHCRMTRSILIKLMLLIHSLVASLV